MEKIKYYFVLTRPINLLIAFISIFIGGFITGTIQPLNKLILACLSGILIMAGANAINDVFDLEIDRINKPKRPLPSGVVSKRGAVLFSIILLISGILVSNLISLTHNLIASASAILVVLYSYRLKRMVLCGNFTVSLITGTAFVYGGLSVGRITEALIVGIFAFLFHFSREILKDIEDIEGDRQSGIVTLPIRHGIKPALAWASGIQCVLIGLTIVPYVIHVFTLGYLIVVILGVDLFLIYTMVSMWTNPEPKNLGRLAVLMKLDMFIGLLAVYFGS